jgi:hypothetical protein
MMGMSKAPTRVAMAVMILLALGVLGLAQRRRTQPSEAPGAIGPNAEFYFIRVQYSDLAGGGRGFGRGGGGGFGRGWWMQDWPRSEQHFTEGVKRLTRIDVGEARTAPLTDDHIFEYPWAYATQVGYWDLTDAEAARLREYTLRGGFLVVDDFWGVSEWEVFRESMERTFPGRAIVEIGTSDPMMHVLYDIGEVVQIPGLRHLRYGAGGAIVTQLEGTPPHWRAIYDDKGRMVVAINYNMDIGDAWEEADVPEYPAESTGLAYRFAINSIIYSMTH